MPSKKLQKRVVESSSDEGPSGSDEPAPAAAATTTTSRYEPPIELLTSDEEEEPAAAATESDDDEPSIPFMEWVRRAWAHEMSRSNPALYEVALEHARTVVNDDYNATVHFNPNDDSQAKTFYTTLEGFAQHMAESPTDWDVERPIDDATKTLFVKIAVDVAEIRHAARNSDALHELINAVVVQDHEFAPRIQYTKHCEEAYDKFVQDVTAQFVQPTWDIVDVPPLQAPSVTWTGDLQYGSLKVTHENQPKVNPTARPLTTADFDADGNVRDADHGGVCTRYAHVPEYINTIVGLQTGKLATRRATGITNVFEYCLRGDTVNGETAEEFASRQRFFHDAKANTLKSVIVVNDSLVTSTISGFNLTYKCVPALEWIMGGTVLGGVPKILWERATHDYLLTSAVRAIAGQPTLPMPTSVVSNVTRRILWNLRPSTTDRKKAVDELSLNDLSSMRVAFKVLEPFAKWRARKYGHTHASSSLNVSKIRAFMDEHFV